MNNETLSAVRSGARQLASLSGETRTKALLLFADRIEARVDDLFSANREDRDSAKEHLSPSLLSRLTLDDAKMSAVVQGVRQLASMPDPLERVLEKTLLDTGLELSKVVVPLGVIAVIFESRPEVLFQLVALALRTGNGMVLKGGSEATRTLRVGKEIVDELGTILPPGWIALKEGREAVEELLTAKQYIDLIIPRGSKELVASIMKRSEIPVLGHADGVCHLYLDKSADLLQALPIIIDAKMQYPAACNALETLLIDNAITNQVMEMLSDEAKKRGIELRVAPSLTKYLPDAKIVLDDEWNTEYSAPILAVGEVSGVEGAITHIEQYGSRHTDGVLAQDKEVIEHFIRGVDSSSVMVNCSTRFADGYRYGLGAEVGIGTGKLHARGPVGIDGLLTYQYQLRGKGHCVSEYVKGAAHFVHKKIV